MTISNVIGCCLIAMVIGVCLGFMARMHTMQDAILSAMAYRAEAQESYYNAQTDQILAQMDKGRGKHQKGAQQHGKKTH